MYADWRMVILALWDLVTLEVRIGDREGGSVILVWDAGYHNVRWTFVSVEEWHALRQWY